MVASGPRRRCCLATLAALTRDGTEQGTHRELSGPRSFGSSSNSARAARPRRRSGCSITLPPHRRGDDAHEVQSSTGRRSISRTPALSPRDFTACSQAHAQAQARTCAQDQAPAPAPARSKPRPAVRPGTGSDDTAIPRSAKLCPRSRLCAQEAYDCALGHRPCRRTRFPERRR